MNNKLCLAALLTIFMFGCSNPKSDSSKRVVDTPETSSDEERLGGFLPTKPYNNETVDLTDYTITIGDFDVTGFPKKMETYGTLFAIMPDVWICNKKGDI